MPHPGSNNQSRLNAGILLVIIFYGLALYRISLQSPSFYFDDHAAIEYNPAIKSIDIPRIFNAFNTRFLPGLSFALNYKWCAVHPAGYRLVNLLIHCLNAFLVYLLARSTLYLYSARKQVFYCPLEWPAFFASMLFLCHPIQTEPVNFITQRFVLMGSFFYLLTLYLYIQYRCQSKKRYLMAAMCSAIAAMFCKEFVITLPFMLTLYEFYFLKPPDETIRNRWKTLLPFFIIILIVPLMLLRTPPEAVGVAAIADSDFVQVSKTQKVVMNIDITRAYGGVGRKQYFLTELNVICTYIRLLFVPVNQNLDYDYPLAYAIDFKTALCGMFLLCLLALATVTHKSYRIISFGTLWFFTALSVESSFIPIGHVIAEYRVYLASVGFVFIVMNLVYMSRIDVKKLNMIAAVILIGFSVLTYQRNNVWKNEITLWSDSVQKSPHKARPYYNYGFAYFNQGNFSKAIPDFNKAIEIKPGYVEAYINRGISYYEEGDITRALSDYNKAIKIDPNVAEAYYNRGNAFMKQNNLIQALSDYNKAVDINPDYAEAYTNRGSIYVRQGNFTQALFNYNKAIKIYPRAVFSADPDIGYVSRSHYNSFADAYYNRGCVYDAQGNLTQALSDYSIAIEINSNHANAYNNRGYIYSRQGNYAQAISDFTKAIAIGPDIAGYYYNRGLSLAKEGNYVQAVSDITKTIAITPDYAAAYYNRAIFYYGLKEYGKALSDADRAEKLGAAVNPEFLSALHKAL